MGGHEQPKPRSSRALLFVRTAVVVAGLYRIRDMSAAQALEQGQPEVAAPDGGGGAVASCGGGDDNEGGDDGGGDDDDEETFTPARLGALALAIVALAFAAYCYAFLDDLPPWLQRCILAGDDAGHPLSKRVAYELDCWFSSNPYSKVLALLYVSIALVLVGGGLLYGVSATGFGDAVWETLAGVGIDWTFASDAEKPFSSASGLLTRLVAIASSLGGMFITALLLGIVSDAVGDYVDDLRKGKSDVLEHGHTLILGWNDKVLAVVEQISNANESEGGGVVVILCEKDKEEQEAEIDDFDYDDAGTTVICRQGNPLLVGDLRKVNAGGARSTIVLADEAGTPDQADARSLRIVLSLVGLREAANGGLGGHVVVEMQDVDNEPLVRMVGGESVETVVAHDVIGRLMIQCAAAGLAEVWGSMLGFEGCEFYVKAWPELVGATFDECCVRFPDAVPLGIFRNGDVLLNPGRSATVEAGDGLVVLAEDDDSYEAAPAAALRSSLSAPPVDGDQAPECVLFCGWRRDLDDIVQLLDDFVVPGSELYLFNQVPVDEQRDRLLEARAQRKRPPELRNLAVHHSCGNLCSRRDLERLPMGEFTSCIILANETVEATSTDRDSQALATLLLLRDIQTQRLRTRRGRRARRPRRATTPASGPRRSRRPASASCSAKSSTRGRSTSSRTRASPTTCSNELASMTLAMVAEDRTVNLIVKHLFEEEGSELYIRNIADYVEPGDDPSFFDVMALARARTRRRSPWAAPRARTAVLNPPDKHEPRQWHPDDRLVVLAATDRARNLK
ncbi:hypothetical protein JL720_9856 [Aureococcus anophagefferens]|nr:hypothetical protein JL720_9856 [Aureococcus anophagefferens]